MSRILDDLNVMRALASGATGNIRPARDYLRALADEPDRADAVNDAIADACRHLIKGKSDEDFLALIVKPEFIVDILDEAIAFQREASRS